MSESIRYPVTKNYLVARSQSLAAPFQRFARFLENEMTVYGVVIDMPTAPKIAATLVAYANGAGNVYFNNGAEYAGAARRYMSVVRAAQMLIYEANQIADRGEPAKNFDMPSDLSYSCYLLTKNGPLHYVYKPSELDKKDREPMLFNYCIRNLMKELHEAQLMDDSKKEKNGSVKSNGEK